MRVRHGKRPARLLNAVVEQRGGVSGGTIASLMNVVQEAKRDPAGAAAAAGGAGVWGSRAATCCPGAAAQRSAS